MKPPAKIKTDFEKVAIGEFIHGYIENIQYDKEHKFKGFQGKEDTVQSAVRFVFELDGYSFKHFSRWMKFTYGEKANLYKKYLAKLVAEAEPDMDFDLDCLKGLRIKTIWKEENEFQEIDSIFPEREKVAKNAMPMETDEEHPINVDVDLEPF